MHKILQKAMKTDVLTQVIIQLDWRGHIVPIFFCNTSPVKTQEMAHNIEFAIRLV